tara:strand:+ start:344 stop:1204 length:861 start_codon:yes stop_codon:yes gene_type:complete
MLNQTPNIYIILFAFLLNISFIYGQDSESNYVVTFTKSSLEPMSEVEDGSASERKELFEEYARKMNPLTPELKMSMILGHYWTGVSTDVLAINAYESIAAADKVGEDEGKTRERAWRRDDVREEFFKNYSKYWVAGHTDLEMFRLIADRTKIRKRKPKENTVITITTHYLAPLSEVDGGSAEERSELFDKYFEEVEMKNDKLLSQIVLGHYWSGKLGYGKGWPIVYVREWASIVDADNNASWSAVQATAWPEEAEREAKIKRYFEYWSGNFHEEMGIYYNWVNLQK